MAAITKLIPARPSSIGLNCAKKDIVMGAVAIKIGKFDPATGQVPVTFRYAGITHKRHVNACLDDAGGYDAAATKVRVADVAKGVAVKIDTGLL